MIKFIKMKEKTKLICPLAKCGKKIFKEPTNSWEKNNTQYFYLICKCGWRSNTPWSECAIDHCEKRLKEVEDDKP